MIHLKTKQCNKIPKFMPIVYHKNVPLYSSLILFSAPWSWLWPFVLFTAARTIFVLELDTTATKNVWIFKLPIIVLYETLFYGQTTGSLILCVGWQQYWKCQISFFTLCNFSFVSVFVPILNHQKSTRLYSFYFSVNANELQSIS